MALYLIGDLQSCYTPFKHLLEKVDFSPSRDQIILLGDMVNRGYETLETVEAILHYGDAIRCLLGNHDIHYLAVAYGLRHQRRGDTLDPLLDSPKKEAYIEWMRQQSMAIYDKGWLMVHAGVAPQWTLEETLQYAKEIETLIRGAEVIDFLTEVFGNEPTLWNPALTGIDRYRLITNALTRIRFCDIDGRLDLDYKLGLEDAPDGLIPWFNVKGRKTAEVPIAFGHWSMLGVIQPHPNLLALDTGCLWGGALTAAKVEDITQGGASPEIIQVQNEHRIQPI